MKKEIALLLIVLTTNTMFVCAQIGPYDKPSYSTFTPLSPQEILMPAMIMQQRYDNNAAKVDALIQYIFQIKQKTNDAQLLASMDKYYKTLKTFYNYDLARMDSQIREIQFAIQEEVDKYNRRVQNETDQAKKKQEIDECIKKSQEEMGKQNNQLALNYIDRAIQLDPDNKNYYCYPKGIIHLVGMHDLLSAIQDFSNYLKSYPDASYAYFYRGLANETLKSLTQADIDYTQCIKYDKRNLEAYYRRGIIKSSLGDRLAAIKDYEYILGFSGAEKDNFDKRDLATVYNNKAYCLVEMGDVENALPLVNKAIEINSTLSFIWDTRGEVYFRKSMYQKCISDMNKAVSLDDRSASSYYYRGLSKIKLGQRTSGIADLSKASGLGHIEAQKALLKFKK